MASQVPAKRGVAFDLGFCLYKNDGTLITNPGTITAKISKDFGNYADIGTVTEEDSTYGQLKAALTNTEMTADVVMVYIVDNTSGCVPFTATIYTAANLIDDIPTVQEIVDGVLDEAQSGHVDSGTIGANINQAAGAVTSMAALLQQVMQTHYVSCEAWDGTQADVLSPSYSVALGGATIELWATDLYTSANSIRMGTLAAGGFTKNPAWDYALWGTYSLRLFADISGGSLPAGTLTITVARSGYGTVPFDVKATLPAAAGDNLAVWVGKNEEVYIEGTGSLVTLPSLAIQNRTEMDTNSTQLAAIVEDTAEIGVAGAGLTALPAVTLANGAHGGAAASLLLGDTNVETALDSILADTNEIQGDLADGGRLDLLLDTAAAADDLDAIADAILKRDWTLITGEAERSLLNAARFLRNKWSISGTTLTVTKEDDATSAWTSALSTDATADPVTGSDPA